MTALVEIIDIDILTPKSLPSIGVYKILLHIVQFVFAFIVLCLSATVISAERSYYSASQAAINYSLVISLITVFLLVPMTIIPWTKLSAIFSSKLREGFFLKSRPNLVFNVFLTICWFINMVAVAVHSNDDSNCSLDSELEKSDSNYVKKWLNQCNCAKAAAAFCVFAFFLWVSTTIICVILFWHEKKLDYSDSKSATIIEEPSIKEEDQEATSDRRLSHEDKQDAILQPTPTTTPLTLTNDFASPYSPSVTHSPQAFTEPYMPPAHHIASPYVPPSELSYIPPQNMFAPSPLTQAYTSPHISATNSPYSAHMSYPPMIQSPQQHHNAGYQYQHSYYP